MANYSAPIHQHQQRYGQFNKPTLFSTLLSLSSPIQSYRYQIQQAFRAALFDHGFITDLSKDLGKFNLLPLPLTFYTPSQNTRTLMYITPKKMLMWDEFRLFEFIYIY